MAIYLYDSDTETYAEFGIKENLAKMLSKAGKSARSYAGAAGNTVKQVAGKAKSKAGAAGKSARSYAGAAGNTVKALAGTNKGRMALGGAALGATALAGGAAYGAKKLMDGRRKRKSSIRNRIKALVGR